jgi:hypothetical protein
MRLPRMTTRRWMLVVGVFALAIGGTIEGVRLKRRHDEFVAKCEHHTERKQFLEMLERYGDVFARGYSLGPFDEDILEREQKSFQPVWSSAEEKEAFLASKQQFLQGITPRLAYHATMARKYERAARYPWLPVEPDPPEPE